MLWADDGYITCLEAYTVRDSWPGETEMDDIWPCEVRPGNCLRPPTAERALMPDCDDRFGTWRVNTSGMTLLESAVLALIALVAIAAVLPLLASRFM
ncbi:MAG: hypothetical protein ABFE13_07925 [Phycisphaerales bacterium]